jgi:hypothetical protein
MKKISEQHLVDLRRLAELYGAEALIAELKVFDPGRDSGRPADLVLNTGIIWAHVEFLKLHRVTTKKKRLEGACALLAEYLNRYTTGARVKSEVTLKNIYKGAQKKANEEPLIGMVMKDAYRALLQYLGGAPQKIPIPYLVQGSKAGWEFPIVDLDQIGDYYELIGSEGPSYFAAFSAIVTPKNI